MSSHSKLFVFDTDFPFSTVQSFTMRVALNADLKFPQMREELIEYLRELSDFDVQKKEWIASSNPDGHPKSQFDYSVHFLFDDTCLATEPNEAVGWYLNDEKEAQLISDVVNALNQIFDRYGVGLSDEDYMKVPEWMDVLNASAKALEVVEKGRG